MRFRLFGVPVEVQSSFWLLPLVLGFQSLMASDFLAFLLWIPILFVSIMVHEFGHAAMVRRFRMEPSVSLYALGGLTSWRPGAARVGRRGQILIAFAGPAAGFILAGLIYAVRLGVGDGWLTMPPAALFVAEKTLWVNWAWGLFNLIPVLPFDGGHILEHALGPRRVRITAIISLICGLSIAVYFFVAERNWWIPFLVGMGAVQSYQRFQAEAAGVAHASPNARRRAGEPAPSPEIASKLARAKEALAEDDHGQALELAESVLGMSPPDGARRQALEIVAWVQLLLGRTHDAAATLRGAAHLGSIDLALQAAVLRARGDRAAARSVLEHARAGGDQRKAVVGPLIQVLIEDGEVARAAALALDIVESLSEEDARQMAQIATEAAAHEWASRLSEAIFARSGEAEDAYAAARSRALEGDEPAAIDLLRRAVAAGFHDASRAFSDGALEKLRADGSLDALFPRADAEG